MPICKEAPLSEAVRTMKSQHLMTEINPGLAACEDRFPRLIVRCRCYRPLLSRTAQNIKRIGVKGVNQPSDEMMLCKWVILSPPFGAVSDRLDGGE